MFLLDNLDSVFSGLINYLYQDQVIDRKERDDVRTERTSVKQNERLLTVLGRKSRDKIQLFFKDLAVTGQSHIRNKVTGRQGDAYVQLAVCVPLHLGDIDVNVLAGAYLGGLSTGFHWM